MKNILFLTVLCFILTGCSGGSDKQNTNDNKGLSTTFDSLNQSAQNVISSVANTTSKAIEKADEITKEPTQKVNDITQSISQKADETAKALSQNVEKISQKGKDIAQEADESISQAAQNVNKAADQIAQKAKDTVNTATSSLYDLENGKKVFRRCIPCHGTKANLSAVGKSQDISKWSKENIENALKGYKDGTYGGTTKSTMVSSIKTLNQQDITDVASYISTLGE